MINLVLCLGSIICELFKFHIHISNKLLSNSYCNKIEKLLASFLWGFEALIIIWKAPWKVSTIFTESSGIIIWYNRQILKTWVLQLLWGYSPVFLLVRMDVWVMLHTAWNNIIIKSEQEYEDFYYFLANTEFILEFWTNSNANGVQKESLLHDILLHDQWKWEYLDGLCLSSSVRYIKQIYTRSFVSWNLSRKYQPLYTCNIDFERVSDQKIRKKSSEKLSWKCFECFLKRL